MRFIDDIIRAINDHSGISPVHKQVLINRIEKRPTTKELEKARQDVGRNKDGSLK